MLWQTLDFFSAAENEPLAGRGPAKFLHACTAHRQRDREKRGDELRILQIPAVFLLTRITITCNHFLALWLRRCQMSVMILSGWNFYWYCLILCHAKILFRACLLRLKNTMPMKSVRNRSLFDLSEHVASSCIMLHPLKASRDFHDLICMELRGSTKPEDHWIWRQALPACLCNCLAMQISQLEVTPDSPNVQSVRKLPTLFLSELCVSSSGQESTRSTRTVWLWFDQFCTLKSSSGFACFVGLVVHMTASKTSLVLLWTSTSVAEHYGLNLVPRRTEPPQRQVTCSSLQDAFRCSALETCRKVGVDTKHLQSRTRIFGSHRSLCRTSMCLWNSS